MIGLWAPPGEALATHVWASPDGVHWTLLTRPSAPAYTGSDTQQVAFWDAALAKYVVYRRQVTDKKTTRPCRRCVSGHCGSGTTPDRIVGRCVSDSLAEFPGCSRFPRQCKGNCTTVFGFGPLDSPCTDVYTSQAIKYHGVYLMFPAMYDHFPNQPVWPCANDGRWDTALVASRDGVSFGHVGGDRRPWLSRGRAGRAVADCGSAPESSAWDSAMVALSQGYFVDGDDIIMFKYGDNLRHGQCTDGSIIHSWPGTCGLPRHGRGGGFVKLRLRLDGFASVGPANVSWPQMALGLDDLTHPAAMLTTPPIALAQDSLLAVNYRVSGGSKLLVEVLGSPTRTASACWSLMGDEVAAEVRWGSSDEARVIAKGDDVTLRFLFWGDAQIFSFWFSDAPDSVRNGDRIISV